MQIKTTPLLAFQASHLRAALGDVVTLVRGRVLIDVVDHEVGALDVTDVLAALTGDDRFDARDGADIVDVVRTAELAIERACRARETELGLARGHLGIHVAGLAPVA